VISDEPKHLGMMPDHVDVERDRHFKRYPVLALFTAVSAR
jgi:hypothetical protein